MCRDIKMCCNLFTFWKSLDKKCFFWGQKVVHYYMVYYTDSNLQICIYAQKRRICRENSKYALGEKFYGHFCPLQKAANFCTPGLKATFFLQEKQAKKVVS